MSREIEQSSSAKQCEGNISRGLRESLLNRMGPKGDDKGEKRVLEKETQQGRVTEEVREG